MNEQMGELVRQAGLSYQFGPADGPEFFARCGWKPVQVRSVFRTAAELNRLPAAMKAFAAMPDPPQPWKLPMPWSAVCLLERSSLIRGASPLGLPDTRSRAPLRRRAPFAWLARDARSHLGTTVIHKPLAGGRKRGRPGGRARPHA